MREQTDRLATELLSFCRSQDWAGHDPYDGLESRLFQKSPFRKNRLARLVLIQGVKRCPVNLRPMLGVPRTANPKALALFISSSVRLKAAGITDGDYAAELIERLLELRSAGMENVCWGYNFAWQQRYVLVPKFDPNIICTTFGASALLDAYEDSGGDWLLDAARSAGDFVVEDLDRTDDGDSFCFSYTRGSRSQVHNASLLGAALLARLWRHTGESDLKDLALRATKYSVDRQASDGSWIYGEGSKQGWIDSFHTGYNLMALSEIAKSFGAEERWISESIKRGYAYYREAFFLPGGIVKYFSNAVYPVDTHAIGQAIITLAEFSTLDPGALARASEIVDWARREMRSPKGFYYYQKRKFYKVRIPYMRWSLAWMLLGLAALAHRLTKKEEIANAAQ